MKSTLNAKMLLFIVLLIPMFRYYFSIYNIGVLGSLGDFFGGIFGTIFTAISVFYLYKQLKVQTNNEVQKLFDNHFADLDLFLKSTSSSGTLVYDFLVNEFKNIKNKIDKIVITNNKCEYSNEQYESIFELINIAKSNNNSSINRLFDYFTIIKQVQEKLIKEKEQFSINQLRLNWIDESIKAYAWLMDCIYVREKQFYSFLFNTVYYSKPIFLNNLLLFKVNKNSNQQLYADDYLGCLNFVNECKISIFSNLKSIQFLGIQIQDSNFKFPYQSKIINKMIQLNELDHIQKDTLIRDILEYKPSGFSSIELELYIFFKRENTVWKHINKIVIQSYTDSKFSIHIN